MIQINKEEILRWVDSIRDQAPDGYPTNLLETSTEVQRLDIDSVLFLRNPDQGKNQKTIRVIIVDHVSNYTAQELQDGDGNPIHISDSTEPLYGLEVEASFLDTTVKTPGISIYWEGQTLVDGLRWQNSKFVIPCNKDGYIVRGNIRLANNETRHHAYKNQHQSEGKLIESSPHTHATQGLPEETRRIAVEHLPNPTGSFGEYERVVNTLRLHSAELQNLCERAGTQSPISAYEADNLRSEVLELINRVCQQTQGILGHLKFQGNLEDALKTYGVFSDRSTKVAAQILKDTPLSAQENFLNTAHSILTGEYRERKAGIQNRPATTLEETHGLHPPRFDFGPSKHPTQTSTWTLISSIDDSFYNREDRIGFRNALVDLLGLQGQDITDDEISIRVARKGIFLEEHGNYFTTNALIHIQDYLEAHEHTFHRKWTFADVGNDTTAEMQENTSHIALITGNDRYEINSDRPYSRISYDSVDNFIRRQREREETRRTRLRKQEKDRGIHDPMVMREELLSQGGWAGRRFTLPGGYQVELPEGDFQLAEEHLPITPEGKFFARLPIQQIDPRTQTIGLRYKGKRVTASELLREGGGTSIVSQIEERMNKRQAYLNNAPRDIEREGTQLISIPQKLLFGVSQRVEEALAEVRPVNPKLLAIQMGADSEYSLKELESLLKKSKLLPDISISENLTRQLQRYKDKIEVIRKDRFDKKISIEDFRKQEHFLKVNIDRLQQEINNEELGMGERRKENNPFYTAKPKEFQESLNKYRTGIEEGLEENYRAKASELSKRREISIEDAYKILRSSKSETHTATRLMAFANRIQELNGGQAVDLRTFALQARQIQAPISEAVRVVLTRHDEATALKNRFGDSEIVGKDVNAWLQESVYGGRNFMLAFLHDVSQGHIGSIQTLERLVSESDLSQDFIGHQKFFESLATHVAGNRRYTVGTTDEQGRFEDNANITTLDQTLKRHDEEGSPTALRDFLSAEPEVREDSETFLSLIEKGQQLRRNPGQRFSSIKKRFGNFEKQIARALAKGEKISTIGSILGRVDTLHIQMTELLAEITRMEGASAEEKSTNAYQESYIDLRKKHGNLTRRIANEPRNQQRRLYGIVMQGHTPVLATPEVLNTRMLRGESVPFFGLHKEDLHSITSRTPEQLRELARSLGLEAGTERWLNPDNDIAWEPMNHVDFRSYMEAQKKLHGIAHYNKLLAGIPLDEIEDEQIQAQELLEGLGVEHSLSPAQAIIINEMHHTGVFRHMGFEHDTGMPTGAILPTTNVDELLHVQSETGVKTQEPPTIPATPSFEEMYSRTGYDPRTESKLFAERLATDPTFVESIIALQEKGLELKMGGFWGRIFRDEGTDQIFFRGNRKTLAIGEESTINYVFPIQDLYEATGSWVDSQYRIKQEKPTNSRSKGITLSRVTDEAGNKRTLALNARVKEVDPETVRRTWEYFQRPQGVNLVALDIETNTHGGIASIALNKMLSTAGGFEEGPGQEFYTQNFYEKQRRNYLRRKGEKPTSIPIDEKEREAYLAKFEEEHKDFAFTHRNIRSEELQIVEQIRTLKEMLEDGHTKILIQNATFDFPRLVQQAYKYGGQALANDLLAQREKILDSLVLYEAAFPERSDTRLETVSSEYANILTPQTHTGADDNLRNVRTVHEATKRIRDFKDFEMEELDPAGMVMTFADEPHVPVLVKKITPPSTRQTSVEVIGHALDYDEWKKGNIVLAHKEARVAYSFKTMSSLALHLDQGRIAFHDPTQIDEATRQKVIDDIELSTRDRAMRLVRKGRSDSPVDRDFHILRGEIADQFGALRTKKEREDFLGQVLYGMESGQNLSPAHPFTMNFETLSDQERGRHARRLISFFTSTEEGDIYDQVFRDTVSKAGQALRDQWGAYDKPFLDMVQRERDKGVQLSAAELQRRAIAYQKAIEDIQPIKTEKIGSWGNNSLRSITLRQDSDRGVFVRTMVDLTALNEEDIQKALTAHVTSLVSGTENLEDRERVYRALRQTYIDIQATNPELYKKVGNYNINIPAMARMIAQAAHTDEEYGLRDDVHAKNYLEAPELPEGFYTQIEQRYGKLDSPEFGEQLSREGAKIMAERLKQVTQIPSTGPSVIILQGDDPKITVNIPKLEESIGNQLRNVFTNFGQYVDNIDRDTATKVAIGTGIAGVAAALVSHFNVEKEDSELGAGDSTNLSPAQMNRIQESKLGFGRDDRTTAEEGYRRLKVSVSGIHLGLDGKRLSPEALAALSRDISSTLSNHLQADIDDDSEYAHSSESNEYSPGALNSLFGKIISRL